MFRAAALMNSSADTAWIVERSKALGFDLCGVVRAEKFSELQRTEEWLARGYAGEMNYLADPRRSDPQTVMREMRSVIVCALNYNAALPRSTEVFLEAESEARGWISRYAWGDDYHDVLRWKLQSLADALGERFAQPFGARIYSDTGPINERVFAKHAGLGWLGKNTLLLNSKIGSWFFLGAILTTLDIPPTLGPAEAPATDLCGSCTRCLDACPTNALVEPYLMDSRLCIAYLTIELRSTIPEALREPMGRHVFGCDICQDVCPWNRRAPVTEAPEFRPRAFPSEISTGAENGSAFETGALGGKGGAGPSPAGRETLENESLFLPRLEWLASMTEDEFRANFRGSPIRRAKWRGLIRNACIALGNSHPVRNTPGHERVRRLLAQLSSSPEPIISESAQWALARIQ